MTEREIRNFINQISPLPGYILNLTKVELSDLIFDLTGMELEQYEQNGSSNAKRLATFLSTLKNTSLIDKVTTALLERKDKQ